MAIVRSLEEIRDMYSELYDDPSYSFHSNSSAEPSSSTISYLRDVWSWIINHVLFRT